MGFSDTLGRTPRAKKGPRCSVGVFLLRLEPDERQQVEEAFGDGQVGNTRLMRAIESEFDERIGTHAIGRHRRGECLCRVDYGIR